MNESQVWVSHVWALRRESFIFVVGLRRDSFIFLGHDSCICETWRIQICTASHIIWRMSHVLGECNPCHTYEWVTNMNESQIWMSHKYEWVTNMKKSRIRMRHVLGECNVCHKYEWVTNMNESQIRMSHRYEWVTNMNASRLRWMQRMPWRYHIAFSTCAALAIKKARKKT